MKILSVYECQISGGTDRLLIHLIKNWVMKDDYWRLYCHRGNSGNELIAKELGMSAEILFYGKKNKLLRNKAIRLLNLFYDILQNYLYFINQIKKNKPDIVFLMQGGYPGAFSAQAAAAAAKKVNPRIKVIVSIQNLPAMRDKKIFVKLLDKFNNKNIDQFIFASKYTAKEYLRKTKLDPQKFTIVPEGVSANSGDKIIRNDTGIINIGIIGSYEKRKGRDVLFQAVEILIDKGITNFKILSYGQKEFGEFNYYVKLAKKLEIENYIEWKDFEKNFDKLYGNLDIITQPSIDSESMPLVPIDAMAYHKPVIASKLQGLLDEIIHNETGYLFDVGDYEALANYLEELILNKAKREKMGESARKRYLENFTADKMANRYYDVFTK